MNTFKLERVGAGPGVALFSCNQLIGVEAELVEAAPVRILLHQAAALLGHSSCACPTCVGIRDELAAKIDKHLS